jgi:hypothetical protein
MATIITRQTGGTAKNSALTNTELDNNFINLNNNKVEQDSATGAAQMPTGTDAQQPAGTIGQFRFNTDSDSFEGYTSGGGWGSIAGSGGPQVYIQATEPSTWNIGDVWIKT